LRLGAALFAHQQANLLKALRLGAAAWPGLLPGCGRLALCSLAAGGARAAAPPVFASRIRN
jgi:hypothetical protein